MAKEITPIKLWNLYQKYDYLGEEYKYKNWIFRDNGGQSEMAIDNKKTGKQIESVTMHWISKKDFIDLMNRIEKKNPKNMTEWLLW